MLHSSLAEWCSCADFRTPPSPSSAEDGGKGGNPILTSSSCFFIFRSIDVSHSTERVKGPRQFGSLALNECEEVSHSTEQVKGPRQFGSLALN